MKALTSALLLCVVALSVVTAAPIGKPEDVGLSAPRPILADAPSIKIDVRANGWYRIGQPELLAAGLDADVDPDGLRLFADGIEQPMVVNARRANRLFS